MLSFNMQIHMPLPPVYDIEENSTKLNSTWKNTWIPVISMTGVVFNVIS